MPLDIRYFATVSSDGQQTTTGANEVITFPRNIGALNFKAVNGLTLIINDNTAEHHLSAGDTIEIEGLSMYKITIVESGVSYQYEGLA